MSSTPDLVEPGTDCWVRWPLNHCLLTTQSLHHNPPLRQYLCAPILFDTQMSLTGLMCTYPWCPKVPAFASAQPFPIVIIFIFLSLAKRPEQLSPAHLYTFNLWHISPAHLYTFYVSQLSPVYLYTFYLWQVSPAHLYTFYLWQLSPVYLYTFYLWELSPAHLYTFYLWQLSPVHLYTFIFGS